MGNSHNIQNSKYFAGPLNLNRQTKEASTVMGTSLNLSEKEFDVLDKLILREGEPVSAAELNAADIEMSHIMKQVNEAGEGFMRIEYNPESGYAFRTRWGRNWLDMRNPDSAFQALDAGETAGEPARRRKRRVQTSLAAITVTAAIFAYAALPMMHAVDKYAEITEPVVPLASFMESEAVYPEIGIVTIEGGIVGAAGELYNPEGNKCLLQFEITLADTGETLYASEPVAPGAKAEGTAPAKGLQAGEYRGTLKIRSYGADGLIEIGVIETDITIMVT